MNIIKISTLCILIKICKTTNLANSMFAAINQKRKENGLSALRSIVNLQNSARDQVLYLCENSILTHDNPNGDLQQRVKRNGFDGSLIGENISKNHSDEIDIVIKMWMGSLNHRKNIMGNYKYTGVSTCVDKKGKRFWVQVFGNENSRNKQGKDLDSENNTMPNEDSMPKSPSKDFKNDDQNNNKDNRPSRENRNRQPKGMQRDRYSRNRIPQKSTRGLNSLLDDYDLSNEYPELDEEPFNQPRRFKRAVGESISSVPCEKTISPSLLRKIPEIDLPKFGSIVSTQIIYVFSTPSAFKTANEGCSSKNISTVFQTSDEPITRTLTQTSIVTTKLESKVTKYLTITKNEIKTVSEFNTLTITKTECSTVSPSISVESSTKIITETRTSQSILKSLLQSTTTKTITKTVEVTKSVMMKPIDRSPRKMGIKTKKNGMKEHVKSREPKRRYKSEPVLISTVIVTRTQSQIEDEETEGIKENSRSKDEKPYTNENEYGDNQDQEDESDEESEDNQREYASSVQPTVTVIKTVSREPNQARKVKPETRKKQSEKIPKNNGIKDRNVQNEIKQSLENILSSGLDISLNIKPKRRETPEI